MNEQEWEDKLAEVQKHSEHWYNRYKDLENKIADIKANCDLAIEGRDIKIKELEKENTELRDKIEHRNCVDCSNHGSNIKLTKAKEIVKGLYFIIQSRIDYANNTGIADEMWRAEQFLKEIEK